MTLAWPLGASPLDLSHLTSSPHHLNPGPDPDPDSGPGPDPGQVRTSEEAAAVRGATLASGAKAMLLAVKGGAAFASGEAAWSQWPSW